jgi:hypothetical protein
MATAKVPQMYDNKFENLKIRKFENSAKFQ